jgi:hypothetical protein
MSKFSTLKGLRGNKAEETEDPKPDIPLEQEQVIPHEPVQPQQETQQSHPTKVGKRNNPDYVQRTAYIRRQTDLAVKMKLLQQGGHQEFSELVDELLTKWLQEK